MKVIVTTEQLVNLADHCRKVSLNRVRMRVETLYNSLDSQTREKIQDLLQEANLAIDAEYPAPQTAGEIIDLLEKL